MLKKVLNYEVSFDGNKRLTADLRIIKKDKTDREKDMDVTASIPEVRVLAKFYQIPSFGVKVFKIIDLNRARNLPTKSRLEYLESQEIFPILYQKAYPAFKDFFENPVTDVFFGKFGEKYETEVYYEFYAF